MKRVDTSVILFIAILSILPTTAKGTLIRHTFGGSITSMEGITPPAPWDNTVVGSIWELSYIFDTNLPDQNPGDSREGRYFIDNGSISMDGVELFAVSGVITVHDGLLGFDEYEVSLFDTPLGGGNIFLTSPPGTLASDAIPIDLDLTNWNFMQYQGGDAQTFFFQGNVLSFSSEIVPAPGAWLLLVIGSIVRGGKRCRRSPA